MTITSALRLSFAVALLVTFPTAGIGDDVTEEEFHQLSALLMPDETELWRTIPWKIELLAAQRTAVTEHKPIFIWAMDGHPLGCT